MAKINLADSSMAVDAGYRTVMAFEQVDNARLLAVPTAGINGTIFTPNDKIVNVVLGKRQASCSNLYQPKIKLPPCSLRLV